MKKRKIDIILSMVSVVLIGAMIAGCSSKSTSRRRDRDDDEEEEEYDSDEAPWFEDKGDNVSPTTQSAYYEDDADYEPTYEETYQTTAAPEPVQTQNTVSMQTVQELSQEFTSLAKGFTYPRFCSELNGTNERNNCNFVVAELYGPDLNPIQSDYANNMSVKKIECDSSNPYNLKVYLTYSVYNLSLPDAITRLKTNYGFLDSQIYYSEPVFDEQGNIISEHQVWEPSNWTVNDVYFLNDGGVYLAVVRNGAATLGNGLEWGGSLVQAFIEGYRGN